VASICVLLEYFAAHQVRINCEFDALHCTQRLDEFNLVAMPCKDFFELGFALYVIQV
jgi:hypothetical protein